MSEQIWYRGKKWSGKWLLVIVPLILLMGIFAALLLTDRADKEMREDFLYQAGLLAEGFELEYIRLLEGSEEDIYSPVYLRIKEQLVKIKTLYPQARLIYLMGEKDDGTVFFFADSEASGTEIESPPGQIYSEISEETLKVFENGKPMVTGPVKDSWGNWITALVPLSDPSSGEFVAVLGMDKDAANWKREILFRSLIPAGILTFALILIAFTGYFLLRFRNDNRGIRLRWMSYLEAMIIFAAGLVLTAFSAWYFQGESIRNQAQAFKNLAKSRTDLIIQPIRDLGDKDLLWLNKFFELSEEIPTDDFHYFTEDIKQSLSVEIYGWIPAIPAAEKEDFEAMARKAGLKNFEIWQTDSEGNREPVSGRDFYYPIYRQIPSDINPGIIGFDMGSETIRSNLISLAIESRMISASDPLLLQEPSQPKGMLIIEPFFSPYSANHLQGFSLAVIRLDNLLPHSIRDSFSLKEIFMVNIDGSRVSLVSNFDKEIDNQQKIIYSRPFFAFGKVFLVRIQAGSDFLNIHPARDGLAAAFIGFSLTLVMSLYLAVQLSRREDLEIMVAERTAELRDEQERLKHILDITGTGIDIVDGEYNLQFVNEGWQNIYGDFRGRKCFEYFRDRDKPCIECAVKVALESKEVVVTEKTMPKEDSKFVEIHTIPFLNSDGRWLVAEFKVDITRRKKVEEIVNTERAQFLALLNSIDEAIYIADPVSYELLYVNRHLARLLPENHLGDKCYKILQGLEEPCSFCTNELIMNQKPESHRWEFHNKLFDRHYSIVDKIIKWSDGRDVRFEMAVDITFVKQAEKLLAAKNKELEQIVYVASHDLRSPLVNVDGFSRELQYSLEELLALLKDGDKSYQLKQNFKKQYPDMEHSLKMIRNSVRQMDLLLKGLLKLSRTGRAAVQIVPLDMNELMAKVVSTLAFQIKESGAEVIIEELPPCKGDDMQLTQVFSNLLDNALKFLSGERVGKIRISGKTGGGKSLYYIEDNGVGIAENHQENIFEIFHRLNPGDTEGEGLGLTIARQVLGRLDGEIRVESNFGKGSIFIVTLPFGALTGLNES